MRKLYQLLLLVGGGIFLSGSFSGCSSDSTNDNPDGPNDPDEPKISVSLTNDASLTTSIVLKLETSGISEYAWSVSEGEVTTLPKPEIIFANAQENGQKAEAKEGVNTIAVKGLKGNTKYTVFVASKSANGYEEVQSVSFTTADYSQIVTVVDVQQFSMTFHVKMAADKYYRWTLVPYVTYVDMKEQMGMTDADYLLYNSGLIGQGEQTITIIDGKMADGSDPADPDLDVPMEFKVGHSYALLIGECDAEGELMFKMTDDGDWGGDLLSVPVTRAFPDSCIGEYTEVCSDTGITFNGAYAKQCLTAAPATLGAGEVKAEVTEQTSKHVTFHLAPTSDVIGYATITLPVSAWDAYVEMYGEAGAISTLTELPMEAGETDLVADDLVVGEKYCLLILSAFSQDFSVQKFQKIPFEAKNSTMPVPELVITGIDAPADSEQKGPYFVWFNIKAPGKDLAAAKYSCEYTKNWVPLLNAGESSINEILNKYGVSLEADMIASINSDAGLNMSFSSWENIESRLYVQAFNTDELSKIYWGASTSPEEPAKERVESSLFNDLLGDWTAVYKNDKSPDGAKFKVTIAAAPECPEGAISADLKKTLTDYYVELKGISASEAAALVEAEYKNYQDRAKRFGEKYREQNRLVCRGFEIYDSSNPYFSYYKIGYTSPWDLFGDTSYSAYATDDLFYDYGAKWFIEIGKDPEGRDIMKVAANPNYISPLQNTKANKEYHLGFPIAGQYYSYGALDFPVTISDDKQTMLIQGLSLEGEDGKKQDYYPSLIHLGMGSFVQSDATGVDAITLTRGWEEPSASQQSVREVKKAEPQNGRNNHFYRTKLFYNPQAACKKVVVKPVTELPRSEKAARMAARMRK